MAMRVKRGLIRTFRFVRARCLAAWQVIWVTSCCVLPSRWSFAFLTIANLLGVGHTMAVRFAPFAARKLAVEPNFQFSSALTRLWPELTARVMFQAGLYTEGVDVLTRAVRTVRSAKASLAAANMLFEAEQFERARRVLARWFGDIYLLYYKGLLELISGDEEAALPLLLAAGEGMPHLLRPHQNLAARSSTNYTPNVLDFAAGRQGRLYDAYNYLGQRVTHVGAGQRAAGLYAKAFNAQRQLRSSSPLLSPRLQSLLSTLGVRLPEISILPDEWITQIGHQGMMDILFKMRVLGWWTGRALLLASYAKVANHAYLSLFKDECTIILFNDNYESRSMGELSSLQRHCGLSFNAFTMPNGDVVPWQDAGAMLTRQWESEKRGHPVRERYDREFELNDDLQAAHAGFREAAGMKPGDWYVCLHMRDAAHYGEVKGTGQTHRNAAVDNYLPAIRHIIKQGGWVIKLGGRSSPKLPQMKRLIDYSRSAFKSDSMDLHLIRHARFFIGTTSGLTHVPLSFGVPCALVNCITIDSQLWGEEVRFALKPIIGRDGRMLSQQELTTTPWRWRVFSASVMARYGIKALENRPDEILETIKEVESLASDTPGAYVDGFPQASSLLKKWQASLGLPYFYGSSRPSLYYLNKYETDFLAHSEQPATADVAAE